MNDQEKRNDQKKMTDLKKQGFALVLVVWVLSLLSLMAVGFTGQVRVGSGAISTASALYRLKSLSEAALQRGLHALFNPGETSSWKLDGQEYEFSYGGARLFFSIQSEAGKVDLNSASDELLLGLFDYMLIDNADITAQDLLDQLRDWQDEDDLPRLQGAEYNDYELDGAGYGPSNMPLRSILEFQQLKNVDPQLARAILPLVTVYSHKATINPLYAGEKLLRALPGVRGGEVDNYITARAETPLGNPLEKLPVFTGGSEFLDGDMVTVYTVTGRALLPSGQQYDRSVIVWLGEKDRKNPEPGQLPYWLLEVRE